MNLLGGEVQVVSRAPGLVEEMEAQMKLVSSCGELHTE